jgi:hypothetical protein
MSKKQRSRNSRGASTSVRNDLRKLSRTISHKEYPDDRRLLFTGWGLLFVGTVLWFLANHFMWSGWIKSLNDPLDMLLMGIGVALVIANTIGIAKRG